MRRRRQSLPTDEVLATIEKLSHDGRGIARINGKITFIEGALANETVLFTYTRQKRDFDEGRLVTVVNPSSERVQPMCPHYALCGGCSLQHVDSEAQLHEKQYQLQDMFQRIGHCEPEVLLSPMFGNPWHYRNKARLSVRYVEKKSATLIGFRERHNPRYITDIQTCSVLNKRVADEIPNLRRLVDSVDDPHSLAQIEVAAGDQDVALILRHMSPLSPADLEKIKLFAEKAQFLIYLQPGGVDSVHLFHGRSGEAESEFLTYQLPEFNLTYHFHPTDFTQVNATINQMMVQRALTLLDIDSQDVILDLFCGLGNFSLPLAQVSNHVIAVEGSSAMVERAYMNAQRNQLSNLTFLCANLEDEMALQPLLNKNVNKVLLDPPRVGAQAVVKQMQQLKPERIVYISCNPITLARDADILVNEQGYRFISAGVMDMFPHTSHVESIALFVRD